jgi:hypothetical protein
MCWNPSDSDVTTPLSKDACQPVDLGEDDSCGMISLKSLLTLILLGGGRRHY